MTLTQKREYVISYLPSVIIICSVSLIIKTTTTVMRICFHRISNWRWFPPPAPPAFLAVPSGMHIKVFLIFKGKLGHPLLASFGNKSELQPTSLESAVVKLNLYTNFNVVFFIFFYGFERSLGFFPPAMSFCPWLQQSESACDETVFLNAVCYSF